MLLLNPPVGWHADGSGSSYYFRGTFGQSPLSSMFTAALQTSHVLLVACVVFSLTIDLDKDDSLH